MWWPVPTSVSLPKYTTVHILTTWLDVGVSAYYLIFYYCLNLFKTAFCAKIQRQCVIFIGDFNAHTDEKTFNYRALLITINMSSVFFFCSRIIKAAIENNSHFLYFVCSGINKCIKYNTDDDGHEVEGCIISLF